MPNIPATVYKSPAQPSDLFHLLCAAIHLNFVVYKLSKEAQVVVAAAPSHEHEKIERKQMKNLNNTWIPSRFNGKYVCIFSSLQI